MRKILTSVFIIPFLILSLCSCDSTTGGAAGLSLIYGVAATLSLLLLIGCLFLVRSKRAWFILLFSSVFVINVGYTLLSLSTSLEMALWANRTAYLGSVFLPLSMLMIILSVTNTKPPKWLPVALFGLAAVIFAITASPGVLDIYYKEVSFAVVDGVATLIKVYGPLHSIYLVYLLGYFTAMVAVIIRAAVKKSIATTAHAVILAIAVFVNIGVWFIEQITNINFEMLSISYIISELFLLGIHTVMLEHQRLKSIVRAIESVNTSESTAPIPAAMIENPIESIDIDSDHIEIFLNGIKTLTPTEKAIFDAYVARVTTKEVMANLNITENTLKYHNKNIYGKLGITSRKQLLEIHKRISAIKNPENKQ